jgi:hypothetical protein
LIGSSRIWSLDVQLHQIEQGRPLRMYLRAGGIRRIAWTPRLALAAGLLDGRDDIALVHHG